MNRGPLRRPGVGPTAPLRRLADMAEIDLDTTRRPWFTPDTLAAYLQVSDRLIRKWVSEGRLPSYKLDGCRRFDPADVEAFVDGLRDRRTVVT